MSLRSARPPCPATPAPLWRGAASARPPLTRALPLDLADAAPLGAAAAASSLLTAWWAQTAAAAAAAAARPPPEAPRAPAPAAPPTPTSVNEVWAAAWAPFSADAAAASGTAGADAALDAPLLWAQGLRRDARARLLALALAALQAGAPAAGGARAAAALPPLLGRASLAAAAAWLGYEPASLRAAVAPYLLEAAAAEEGAPALAPPPLSEGPWFALDERAALYVAVLRLLRSTSIDAGAGAEASNGEGSADAGGFELALAAPEAAARALRRGGGGVRGWRADGSAASPSAAAAAAAPSPLLAAAPAALQDMAVLVADAVAAAYLADAAEGGIPAGALAAAAGDLRVGSSSSGSSEARAAAAAPAALARAPGIATRAGPPAAPAPAPLEAAWWPTFVHPRLASTRALQRFANRLALARAAHRAFASVAAMYEDRLPLFTLCALRAEGGAEGAGAEGAAPAAAAEVALRVRRVPLRRARELAALRGARLGVALALEGADVAAPALRALWARAGAFLSWLLVHAVGRAAGLVWRGVREGAASLAAGGGGARRPPRVGGAPAAA
jgi:hypothetical protein